MVNAAANLSPDRLSTKALAAAGQFRAIALWLNEPLVPEGVYAQVCQDKRPGCIRITVEFQRTPLQEPLAQFVCHLIWQLNSPLIEGIHLTARPVGAQKSAWEQRIRVMTPALRERLKREQGQGSPTAAIPPTLVARPTMPKLPGLSVPLADQIKTLRAFMLTGSAVAAFVFGCMIEVVMSAKQEPALPFRSRVEADASPRSQPGSPKMQGKEPQLPAFRSEESTVFADRHRQETASTDQATPATLKTTAVSYKIDPDRDRPNVVNAALEPVGVLQHERLQTPEDPTITLLFGGDVDLDGLPYDQFEYDGQLLSGLPIYRQADLATVNLQDPLATAATSLEEDLLERDRPDAINLLKEGGVDLVNLTGEKTLSFGEQGLAETLDTLDRNGIFRVGAGRSEREARRPEIIDVKGQRIAYLSYDRDFTLAADDSLSGVNAVNMRGIIEDIQAIRDEVDWLVVKYRWSAEPPASPAESQTNLARLAIDQGADLVVGHHPQKLQGAELYKGKPIAYSLGDFVFGNVAENPTPETAVLQVALRSGQMKVELLPVKVSNGQPQIAEGTEGEQILQKIYAASQEFQEPMPSTVVLNAHPSGNSGTPDEAAGFTAEDELESTPDAPWDAKEAAPAAPQETAPNDDEAPLKAPQLEAPTAPSQPSSTPQEDSETESLDIPLEEFPEDLLENWGPKESPNTLYEPESALPRHLNIKKPQPDKPSQQRPLDFETKSTESSTDADAVTAPSAPKAGQPSTADTQDEPSPGAIAPYSEPLVGPMSHLPEAAPDMRMHHDAIAPEAQSKPGMPESRVLAPLNTSEPTQGQAINIKAQKIKAQNSEAIAQFPPDIAE